MQYQLFDRLSSEEFSALEADILSRGIKIPIEVDGDGEILDGHHRAEIANKHGLDCPKVVRHFKCEAEKVEHVILLNLARRHLTPLQWGGAFKRLLEVRGVKRGQGSRNDSTSSTMAEVAEQVGVPIGTAEKRVRQHDAYERLPIPIRKRVDAGELTVRAAGREVERYKKRQTIANATERGQQVLPQCKVIVGDCLEHLRKIRPGHARLIIADPPYNIGIDYGEGKAADLRDDYVEWCREWLVLCAQAMADDGSLWLIVSDEYAAEIAVTCKQLLTMRSWVIWYETFGVNCTNKFNRTKRHVFYFVADPKRFVFNHEAVSRPSDRQTKYGDSRAVEGGKLWDDVWQIPRLTGTSAERIPDVPTQIPLAIMRAIVGCASDPGDLVVDPFCGSGSAGHACVEMGRRFIGIEKNPDYAGIATGRLHNAVQ